MVFQTEGTVYAKAWRQEGGQKVQEPGFSKECSQEHTQELIKSADSPQLGWVAPKILHVNELPGSQMLHSGNLTLRTRR